jgi:L-ascorbate metabolism protein UlaG (beta-lactamase superfamily)
MRQIMNSTIRLLSFSFLLLSSLPVSLYAAPRCDTIPAPDGTIYLTFIGHASLMIEWNKKVIHIDPVNKANVYSSLPRGDLILITHEHFDHFEPATITLLKKDSARVVGTAACAKKLKDITVINNGDTLTLMGISIEAVPAYNIVHMRPDGTPFHPKGTGNGYILTLGKKRIYIAGDTENIPEMKTLADIDIAFLPMNLPYTMTPAMVADAAKMFMPKILYPYHFGTTNPQELHKLLKNTAIEVRIRDLQ